MKYKLTKNTKEVFGVKLFQIEATKDFGDVEKGELINIGTGNDISIKDLAEIIANIFKFTGKINWDTSKPKGAPSRSIDCTKISLLGWKIDHNLIDRLNKTYNWYIENKQRY